MSTDRELLELAAKASGLVLADEFDSYIPGGGLWIVGPSGYDTVWNPLTEDGDALRLAVKLGFRVYVYPKGGDDYTVVASDELKNSVASVKESHGVDAIGATRRAIVRAAAEIGRSMP